MEERVRLRKLVNAAQGFGEMPKEDPRAAQMDADNLEDLVALHRWYRDWAETARVAVARRDQQIKLGIAARRAPSGNLEEDAGEEEPKPVS